MALNESNHYLKERQYDNMFPKPKPQNDSTNDITTLSKNNECLFGQQMEEQNIDQLDLLARDKEIEEYQLDRLQLFEPHKTMLKSLDDEQKKKEKEIEQI